MRNFSLVIACAAALSTLGCATSGAARTADPVSPAATEDLDRDCKKAFVHLIDIAVNTPSVPEEDRAALRAGANQPALLAEYVEQCKSFDPTLVTCILAATDTAGVKACAPPED